MLFHVIHLRDGEEEALPELGVVPLLVDVIITAVTGPVTIMAVGLRTGNFLGKVLLGREVGASR